MAPDDMEDQSNKWWKKVFELMKQQEEITLQMATLNNKSLVQNNGGGKECHGSNLDETAHTEK